MKLRVEAQFGHETRFTLNPLAAAAAARAH